MAITLGDCIRCGVVSASYGELVEFTWTSSSASFVGESCSDINSCDTDHIQRDGGNSVLLFYSGAAYSEELWTSSTNIVLEWVFDSPTSWDENVYFSYGCGDNDKVATIPEGTTNATITCTVTTSEITLTEVYS